MKVVISTSFNRFWAELVATYQQFENLGVEILSPKNLKKAGEWESFTYLEGDKGRPEELELAWLNNIGKSDLHYVVTDGYIGKSMSLEIGYALSAGVPVVVSRALNEKPFTGLTLVGTPEEALEIAASYQNSQVRYQHANLEALQRIYFKTCVAKGFDDETPAEIVLLLLEEVGELAGSVEAYGEDARLQDFLGLSAQLAGVAKAIRKRLGIAVSGSGEGPDPSELVTQLKELTKEYRLSSDEPIGGELADIQLYLLHLASTLEVSLGRELTQKELKNAGRFWSRHLPKLY